LREDQTRLPHRLAEKQELERDANEPFASFGRHGSNDGREHHDLPNARTPSRHREEKTVMMRSTSDGE
jgi:hypothetical protein